jgi:DNA-binding transcriptional LysR family regulator
MVAFSRDHAPALFDALIASCQQEGFSPRIAHVARHPASVLQMVQLGLGVSIVPRAYATHAPPAVVFRHLSSMAARLKIDALWREGNPAPGLRRVIDDVLQTFAHDGPPPARADSPRPTVAINQCGCWPP